MVSSVWEPGPCVSVSQPTEPRVSAQEMATDTHDEAT